MKKADVQEFVDSSLKESARLFGLDDWLIHTQLKPLPIGIDACVNLEDAAYKAATITFDAAQLKNVSQIQSALEHELIHILLADFYLYRRVHGNIRSVGEAARKEQELCTWTEERMVRAVERLIKGIRHER